MEVTTVQQQQMRYTSLQSECCVGLVVVGVLVTAMGITSAALLPICYMFYAQVTALGLLYTITGIMSYATSPRKTNFAAKSAVVMTLLILSWITTTYIFQVAFNLIAGSFYPGRSLTDVECGYSEDSTDEILYYSLGGISLLLGVIFLVLSAFVFVAFWREGKPSASQIPGACNVNLSTSYQLQATGGYNNFGYQQDPSRNHVLHAPVYAVDPTQNLPPYTPQMPTGLVQSAVTGSSNQAPPLTVQDDMNKLN